jgi:hypothetical protein
MSEVARAKARARQAKRRAKFKEDTKAHKRSSTYSFKEGSSKYFYDSWIADGETESMVLISDDRNHTKYSVYVFIQHIISHLKLLLLNNSIFLLMALVCR